MAEGRGRDRHGRGLRGPLLARSVTVEGRHAEVPAWRSRTDRFDDVVRDAFDRIEQHWAQELDGVELAVEDVPPGEGGDDEGLVVDENEGGAVPLARAFARGPAGAPRVVVYRRPVEARAEDLADLAELVREVLVDAVAHLLDREPDEIDPP